MTEAKPDSGRLVPDDERPRAGCGGRLMASDCLDADMERPWLLPLMECDRFMADPGWGMAELRLRPPSVLQPSALGRSRCPGHCDGGGVGHGTGTTWRRAVSHHTSRVLRTLQRPVSCDIVQETGLWERAGVLRLRHRRAVLSRLGREQMGWDNLVVGLALVLAHAIGDSALWGGLQRCRSH